MKKILLFFLLSPLWVKAQHTQVELSQIEVSDNKTVHVIFPASVVYVDLGSNDILAGRVEWAENVIRVKSAVSAFTEQTTFSVMTSDNKLYTFLVSYNKDPLILNVIIGGIHAEIPPPARKIIVEKTSRLSPGDISTLIEGIQTENRTMFRSVGTRGYGIDFLLKGLYIHEDIMILHLTITNATNIPYDIDYIRLVLTDRKVARRTPVQEIILEPIAKGQDSPRVSKGELSCHILVIDKVTLPDSRLLRIELAEKNGGRNLHFHIRSKQILKAKPVSV